MNSAYTSALGAALVLTIGALHHRTRYFALVVLVVALALGAFGYWLAASKYDELRTGCMFFAVGAVLASLILAADWWWLGVISKLLRHEGRRNDAV